MKLNRRNVLVGLGTIVAGGGAAIGTGAFSTVEADRSVSVSTTGDADAFVALSPNESSDYSDFVESDSEDEVDIDIGRINGGGKLNQNALSAFDDILQIENNAEDDTDIEITIEAGDGVEFYDGDYDSDNLGIGVDGQENLTIDEGEEEAIGIVVNLREDGDDLGIGGPIEEGEGVDVTIIADQSD